MQKLKYKLYKMMYGRNGVDTLGRFLFVPIGILLVISFFVQGNAKSIIMIVCMLLLIYSYFRMFSKNLAKRRKENNWFERKTINLKTRFKQGKNYRFFDCPNCGAHLRVPRGVGEITITCKKCGHKFDRKA